MSLSIIQKQDFDRFVGNLLHRHQVAGPIFTDGKYSFEWITHPSQLAMEYTTTVLPPKKYLLPQRECMFEFNSVTNRTNGTLKPAWDTQKVVLLGVHTCDLHAIQLLDSVFTKGYQDPHYLDRRKNTLIVSIECLKPCDENCFCKSMGTLTADEGYDLHLTDLGEVYAVDVGTVAGSDLLAKYADVSPANPGQIRQLNGVLSEKWPKFPYRLEFDVSDLPSLLNLSLKSPLWAELGDRCLSCASCTNVCPTCFCFDVKDEVEMDLVHGRRVRVWDSCQLDDFATVAGGHNFRKSRALRQRHRFLRKGKYILDAHGHMGCVGCGRCARACLANINPVSVFNELYRQQEGSHQP